MKNLRRNLKTFYYAPYTGEAEILDESDEPIGEKETTYGSPEEFKASRREASGIVDDESYGLKKDYDTTLTIFEPDIDFEETGILWLDTSDTTQPNDHIITLISENLNSVRIRAKKVR